MESENMVQELAATLDVPDQEIRRRVVRTLAEKNRPSLRQLGVQVCDGVITLSGSVQSFYEKQLAIHSCHSVAGLGSLVDAVQVGAPR